MTLLALDLGISTGWALRRHGAGGEAIESGVQVFDLRRGESPGMRYVRFRRWLDEMGQDTAAHGLLIAYEAAHHRGGAATELLCGLTTRVQEWVAQHPWSEHQAVHSATLKKWVTGRGNADKEAMRAALLSRGWWAAMGRCRTPIDDNEVDAVALLHYAIAILAPLESDELVDR